MRHEPDIGLRCCSTCSKITSIPMKNTRLTTTLPLTRAPRVYIQNVPVNAGTTRTCVSTCVRGASMHGDVIECTHGDVFSVTHHTTPHAHHTTRTQDTTHKTLDTTPTTRNTQQHNEDQRQERTEMRLARIGLAKNWTDHQTTIRHEDREEKTETERKTKRKKTQTEKQDKTEEIGRQDETRRDEKRRQETKRQETRDKR